MLTIDLSGAVIFQNLELVFLKEIGNPFLLSSLASARDRF